MQILGAAAVALRRLRLLHLHALKPSCVSHSIAITARNVQLLSSTCSADVQQQPNIHTLREHARPMRQAARLQ